jgi:hypothetical protein
MRVSGSSREACLGSGIEVHPLEGIIAVVAGTVAWLIGSGRFPADSQKRKDLEVRLPWAGNQKLMYAMAVFLWAFGLAVLSGLVK